MREIECVSMRIRIHSPSRQYKVKKDFLKTEADLLEPVQHFLMILRLRAHQRPLTGVGDDHAGSGREHGDGGGGSHDGGHGDRTERTGGPAGYARAGR